MPVSEMFDESSKPEARFDPYELSPYDCEPLSKFDWRPLVMSLAPRPDDLPAPPLPYESSFPPEP